ncbi:MAG: 16S rRNA (cytosine(1402)-N(4))-methyltransferase RsmH [Leptolyngbyaceae cyanobacterium T60_A2020_046]|nr:16S rRNA (cytosine(1402)-N(4))-methyltransferase RsmH [Leptolyngbyaceae cyanobacterium T60_A2020_046]
MVGSESGEFQHVSVMPEAAIAGLNLQPGGLYLDATVGGGGHSDRILAAQPEVQVVAIDQDEQAIAAAQARLAGYGDRVQFWRGNFADYQPGEMRFHGILADLGVSSPQFDTPERGFSFRHEADLDMRMDQRQAVTAATIINHWDETDLANTFYTYGEERLSRRIARAIVEQRPFHTTTELAAAIARCVPGSYRHGRIHPATRVFQALRIAVNGELTVLETLLQRAPDWLVPGGRLVIISFHSLEDRMVKQHFRNDDRLRVITKKPQVATEAEVAENVRSRSAKLRVAERIGGENPDPEIRDRKKSAAYLRGGKSSSQR